MRMLARAVHESKGGIKRGKIHGNAARAHAHADERVIENASRGGGGAEDAARPSLETFEERNLRE